MSAAHPHPARNFRFYGARLAILAAAVAIGLVLQHALGVRLAGIEDLATRDVVAARAELARLLQIVGGIVFGGTFGVGVSMALASRRALARAEFPPPGVWSWGASRRVTGPRARTLARVWLALASAVALLSAAGLALSFYAAEILLACRAA